MEVSEKKEDGVMVLALKGRLDSNTSNDFEKRLLELIQTGEVRFVLDFEQLDYISSAGLRVLLKAVKELKHSSGKLVICSVKDYIREVFDLSGFISFLPIHATLEDSLKSFQ
jgi:anti-sigma B factor antagonist